MVPLNKDRAVLTLSLILATPIRISREARHRRASHSARLQPPPEAAVHIGPVRAEHS
jgi:hypothetical protein